MTRRDDLTSLVGTRICHDLVNPLGAISNGVELMTLSGVQRSPELDLIEESIQSASARIRFFRIAYGSGADDQMMGRAEITTTLQAAGRSGRISYAWGPSGDQRRGRVRTAFLLLQCLESAMPRGGTITVSDIDGGWQITAEADRFLVDPPLWDSLTNPRIRVDVSAAQVHFALLAEDLTRNKVRLSLGIRETEIVARF